MRWMKLAMALAGLAGLTACGDKDEAADTAASAEECAARALDACEDDGLCTTIDARPFQDDGAGGTCVDYDDPPEPQGCMPATYGCTAALTSAAPASDPADCWSFSSGCIPDGWEYCESDYQECR